MPVWQLRNIRPEGARAEAQAFRYLKKQGLSPVARNFACRRGELDLIMLERDILVFIEVRFRSSQTFGGALSSITFSKQQKLRKTAAWFIQQHREHQHRQCRFDALAITPDDDSQQNRLEWIKGAF